VVKLISTPGDKASLRLVSKAIGAMVVKGVETLALNFETLELLRQGSVAPDTILPNVTVLRVIEILDDEVLYVYPLVGASVIWLVRSITKWQLGEVAVPLMNGCEAVTIAAVACHAESLHKLRLMLEDSGSILPAGMSKLSNLQDLELEYLYDRMTYPRMDMSCSTLQTLSRLTTFRLDSFVLEAEHMPRLLHATMLELISCDVDHASFSEQMMPCLKKLAFLYSCFDNLDCMVTISTLTKLTSLNVEPFGNYDVACDFDMIVHLGQLPFLKKLKLGDCLPGSMPAPEMMTQTLERRQTLFRSLKYLYVRTSKIPTHASFLLVLLALLPDDCLRSIAAWDRYRYYYKHKLFGKLWKELGRQTDLEDCALLLDGILKDTHLKCIESSARLRNLYINVRPGQNHTSARSLEELNGNVVVTDQIHRRAGERPRPAGEKPRWNMFSSAEWGWCDRDDTDASLNESAWLGPLISFGASA
jgi:hypothetical protein